MPPTHQGQQGQPNPQGQPNKAAQSPASAADPFDDPVSYLKVHGVRPLGNPEWSLCLWHDTARPMFDSEETVEIQAYFLRKKQGARKGDAPIAVLDKVMVKDENGQPAPVKQIRYTPGAEPMTMTEALRYVMEREHRKVVEAARAEARRKKQAEALTAAAA